MSLSLPSCLDPRPIYLFKALSSRSASSLVCMKFNFKSNKPFPREGEVDVLLGLISWVSFRSMFLGQLPMLPLVIVVDGMGSALCVPPKGSFELKKKCSQTYK